MENQLDSESYWHRTTRKGFSFDEEVEDDCYEYGSEFLSVKRKNSVGILKDDDTISEASFDNGSDAGRALNLSIKSIISEDNLKQILHEQTLDDRLLNKGVSAEEELKLLRRKIQNTLYNPSAKSTAHKLLQGKCVPMEVFKSLHEKQRLLETVVKCGGGDAVLGVVLFLKKSLNGANFQKILQQQPKVLAQYLNYLKQRQPQEAVDVMHRLNRKQEAAILQFQSTGHCQDMNVRKQNLLHIVHRYGANNDKININQLYQQIFLSALKLIELIEKEQNSLNNMININSTPIEVLYACCSKHTNWKEQDLTRSISPFRLCVEQQISSAQFEWTAMHQRAHVQAYADLENVFERVPTWHPMKQKQFHISFSLDLAITRLYGLNAPSSVLYMLLSKMSNGHEKLQLAEKVKCIKAIIDALAGLKDINQLTQFRATLSERSEEQFYCDKALKSLQTKRWSTDNIRLKL